jgi:glutaredoxin 3
MQANRSTVRVYTLSGCPHCVRARDLLRRRGLSFEEVNGDGEPGFGDRLLELTGRLTVPQIVIGGEPIGGASELARLDRRGLLVPLVRGERFPRAVVRRRINLGGLLTAPIGGTCGLWRYGVELVERDGTVLERNPVTSVDEAAELAAFLNERQAVA